jgi:hypothetical protein
MRLYFLITLFFYLINFFTSISKLHSQEFIPIPDVPGIPAYPEENKEQNESLEKIAKEQEQSLEKHRFFHVRSLPISEGFANRPRDLEDEKLLILGRVQFRGMSGQKESSFNNGSADYNAVDWNFRRVRLGFMYQGGKWWGGQLHLRVEDAINRPYITTRNNPDTGAVEQVNIRDNRGLLQQANIWFNIPVMESVLVLGMFRLPFLREWHTAANMMTPERSFAHSNLHAFDMGVQYAFHPLGLISKKLEQYILARVSMTNGSGAGHEGLGRRAGLTETRGGTKPLHMSPAYHWRVTYNPFGGFIKDGYDVGWHEGEEIFQANQRLSIGIGGASIKELSQVAVYDPNTRGVSPISFLTVQNTPTGGGTDYLLDNSRTTPGRRELGVSANTFDLTYTINGYYFSGAYTRFRGSAANDVKAYNYTLGYLIPIKKMHLMPVFRYDVIEGDFDRNGRRDPTDILKTSWIGFNFFADRHLMKFQLFYQIQQDKFGTNAYTNKFRDMDNNLFYFQVQMTFWSGTLKTKNED